MSSLEPDPESGAAAEPAIETRGLSRRFGDFVAVDSIDLSVPRGSLFGFLGPNGAGKSTTIKCLTGLLRPSAGSVRILGRDLAADPLEIQRRVGVVPEDLGLFERLTGGENLAFVARVHGLDAETSAPAPRSCSSCSASPATPASRPPTTRTACARSWRSRWR